MTCAEFKEQAAAFALGALDREEQAAAEAHLHEPRHEGCLDELRRLADGAELLADSLPPVRPGPAVWEGIAARIGAAGERAPAPAGRRWREIMAVAVAIAAVVALFFLWRRKGELEDRLAQAENARLVALASQREQERLANECRTALAQATVGDVQRTVLAALERQGTQLAQLTPAPNAPPGVGGNVVMDAAQKRAWLVGKGFTPRPGKRYQLWVLAEAPKPAGLLEPDPSGAAVAAFDPSLLDQAKGGFAVSLEDDPSDAKPETLLLVPAR